MTSSRIAQGATVYNAIINGVATSTSNNAGLVDYVNGIENPALKDDLGPWNPTTVAGVYQPGTSQLAQTSLGEIGGNTYSEGFVIKPFENWAGIDEAANNGNILAGFIRTLGFTFNKADNFNPPAGTYTDLLGNPLGKPAGTEKDYGMEIATPDKKLYLRMTWYKSSNQNNTTGVSQTLTDRELYVDQNEMKNWAQTIVELNSGEDPTQTTFGNTSLFPMTTAQYAQMAALTGLNLNWISGNGGNPVTGGFSNAGGHQHHDRRRLRSGNDLQSAAELDHEAYGQSPERPALCRRHRRPRPIRPCGCRPGWRPTPPPTRTSSRNWAGGGSTAFTYIGNFWNSYGYDSNTNSNGNNGGPTTVGNYFQNVVGIPIAVEEAAQGTNVPEETPYTFNYLTNYSFTDGMLKGLGVGGGLRWMAATVEGYYGNTAAYALNATGQVAAPNVNLPVYYPAQLHADAWISYAFKLPWDDGRIRAKVQLNCTDLTSNGYIEPIQFNLDGTPDTWRIMPPRQWALTCSFSF